MASFRLRLRFGALRQPFERLPRVVRGPLAWTMAVALLFLAILWGTRPLAGSLASGLLDPIDSPLHAWIMAWGVRAMGTDPGSLFQAPHLYPVANSLAFGESHLGDLPLFAPLLALSGDAVWAANAFVLLSLFLTAVSTMLLVTHLTRSRFAGLAAGLAFALSPVRLGLLPHLSLASLWWTPLALWMLVRFFERERWRDAALAALFLAGQFAASLELGTFLIVLGGSYAGLRVLLDRGLWRRDLAIKVGVSGVGAALPVWPLLLPYMQLREAWDSGVPVQEAIAHGADLLAYLDAWPGSLLYGSWLHAAPEGSLFPGGLILAGAIGGIAWAWRHRPEPLAREAVAVAGAGAVAFVLSLGPALKVAGIDTYFPLPFLALFHLVPGFDAVRVPAHMGLAVALCLVVLAGIGLHAVLERFGAVATRRAGLAALVLGLLLIDTAARPLVLHPRPAPSELDAFLARRTEGPVVTVPMPAAPDAAEAAVTVSRLVAGLSHDLPVVNGFSAFTPPSYRDLARRLERGPTSAALDALAALGVRTLVVRFDQMPLGTQERWALVEPADMGLEPLWYEDGKAAVYRIIRTPARSERLYATLLLPERLPTGWEFTMGIALNVPGKTVWTAPVPAERQPLRIRWEGPAQTSQVIRAVWLPMTVQGAEAIGVPLRSPARPGRYRLTVEGASLLASAEVEVTPWKATDTLTGPFEAQISWTAPQPSEAMVPGAVLPLRWEVVNQGESLWRARTTWRQRLAARPDWLREPPRRIVEEGAGEVMLEVRWLKRRTHAELKQGQARVRRYPLRHDVFPGQRYVFDETLFVPEAPGGYLVEARLTDAFGTFSSPVERREVLVHELAGLRDFLTRFEGM